MDVDVISILERARDDLKARGQAYINEQAAIEVISELIAADSEYDAAEKECVDHHRTLFKRDRAWCVRQAEIDLRCDAAIVRRATALTAAQGGKSDG